MLKEKMEIIESTYRLDKGGESEIEEIILMQSSIQKVTLLTTVEYAGKGMDKQWMAQREIENFIWTIKHFKWLLWHNDG